MDMVRAERVATVVTAMVVTGHRGETLHTQQGVSLMVGTPAQTCLPQHQVTRLDVSVSYQVTPILTALLNTPWQALAFK